jgi:hypothetical protein
MKTPPARAEYTIDSNGTIVAVDDGFRVLARHHGQPQLPDVAVGRRLLDFVAGTRPRALQSALIARVHRERRPLEVRYRCDSPDERRFGVLVIDPAEEPPGGTVFRTWFERIEPRDHQSLLDLSLPRGERVVWLCVWCNRIDVRGWREVEEAAARLAGTNGPLPRVEHSVCDVCELLLTKQPRR